MRLGALVLLVAALVLGLGLADGPTGAADLLPDLDQRAPSGLVVVDAGEGFRLAFGSAVENSGAGPLVIEASRAGTGVPTMPADQRIRSDDGSTQVVEGIGQLRYVHSSDHRHWHLLDFERYELRRAADYELVGEDRKTGFCLGDRYATATGGGRSAAFVTRCGLDRPGLLRLRQGISPGFGDDYAPALEGQYVDITNVPGGRYVLVHRVNPSGLLLESDYRNNAASLLVRLRWVEGRPRVKTLAVCPDRDRCGP
jgi:hypothetical protein